MKINLTLISVSIFLFAGFLVNGNSEETGTAEPVPDIHFEVSDKDLGVIKEGEVPEFSFRIQNTGTGDLIINKVKGGCGCTKVRVENKTLAPGEFTNILGEFNSKGRPGLSQKKTITVNSNDPDEAVSQLSFTVGVVQLFHFTPKAIHFGNIRDDSSTTRTLSITARSDREMQILSNKTKKSSDMIDVALSDHSVQQPGSGDNQTTYTVTKAELIISVKDGATPGAFRDELLVKTNLPENEEFKVTLIARILGDLLVKPYQAFLGRVNAGSSVTKKFTISSENSQPFKIVDVLSDEIPVTWEIVDDKKATTKKILRVNFDVPGDAVKSRRTEITVVTDHPEQKNLVIPVSASIVNSPNKPTKEAAGSPKDKPLS